MLLFICDSEKSEGFLGNRMLSACAMVLDPTAGQEIPYYIMFMFCVGMFLYSYRKNDYNIWFESWNWFSCQIISFFVTFHALKLINSCKSAFTGWYEHALKLINSCKSAFTGWYEKKDETDRN
jgi:hypothetical protein